MFLDFLALHTASVPCFWIFLGCTERLTAVFRFFAAARSASDLFLDFSRRFGTLPLVFRFPAFVLPASDVFLDFCPHSAAYYVRSETVGASAGDAFALRR